MKRLILILTVSMALLSLSCDAQVKLGNAEIKVPARWRTIVDDKERINILSADERQQATVSIQRFDSRATFEDFKRLCEIRQKAEKADVPDVLISAEEPFVDGGIFKMSYSGNEKAMGRLFSGYLTLKDKELITVYVESIGVDSKKHSQTFEEFVKGLKWR
jgi:hypothetical protein